jgi:hypothetical protein
MECDPGLSELAGLAGLDRLGEDGVTIIVVEHHDVIVAPRSLDWEFSRLIRVGFVEVAGGEHGSKDGVSACVLVLLGRFGIERRG